MTNSQLELSFAQASIALDQPHRVMLSASRRQARRSRATWWFDRMRQLVDRAAEAQPTAPDSVVPPQ